MFYILLKLWGFFSLQNISQKNPCTFFQGQQLFNLTLASPTPTYRNLFSLHKYGNILFQFGISQLQIQLNSNRMEDQRLNTCILRATGTVHSTFNGPLTIVFPFSTLLDYLTHIIIIVTTATAVAATPTALPYPYSLLLQTLMFCLPKQFSYTPIN